MKKTMTMRRLEAAKKKADRLKRGSMIACRKCKKMIPAYQAYWVNGVQFCIGCKADADGLGSVGWHPPRAGVRCILCDQTVRYGVAHMRKTADGMICYSCYETTKSSETKERPMCDEGKALRPD